MQAFLKLKSESDARPSLNFLYAMVGALEDRDWTDIAQRERDRLLFDLEGHEKLEAKLIGKPGDSV